MSEDLDRRFAELAGHGHRTGRLPTAEEVRDRGERRRGRRLGALALLAVAAVGALVLAVATVGAEAREEPAGASGEPAGASGGPAGAGGESTGASGGPTRAATSAPAPIKAAGDALSGEREIFLVPLDFGEEKPDALLSVAREDGDRIQVTDDDEARSLFVPVPEGRDTFLVKTARLRTGGEPLCWQRRSRAPEAAFVVAAKCDAGNKDQLWRFTALYADAQDRQLYGVHVGDEYLLWDPDSDAGLVMRRHADDELRTTFALVDRGPAEL